jgi:regulator of RNase E activity RraA
MLNEGMRDRLGKLFTPMLADALSRLGLPEVSCGREIRPVIPFSRMVGTAVTLKVRARQGDEAAGMPHYRAALDTGDRVFAAILVIEVAPQLHRHGVFGSGAATFGRTRSFVGAVVDGSVRDSHELDEMRFPVHARGLSPLYLVPRAVSEFCNQPVRIGEATISPGEVLCADNDGILVLQPDSLEAVVTRAEEIEAWEHRVFSAFARSGSYDEALAAAGEMP